MPPYIGHILVSSHSPSQARPNAFCQFQHTLPFVTIVVEATFYFHPLPPRRVALRLLFLVGGSYIALISYIGYSTGHWVYPFLQMLPDYARVVAMVALLGASSASYLAGEVLHRFIWREYLKYLKDD